MGLGGVTTGGGTTGAAAGAGATGSGIGGGLFASLSDAFGLGLRTGLVAAGSWGVVAIGASAAGGIDAGAGSTEGGPTADGFTGSA